MSRTKTLTPKQKRANDLECKRRYAENRRKLAKGVKVETKVEDKTVEKPQEPKKPFERVPNETIEERLTRLRHLDLDVIEERLRSGLPSTASDRTARSQMAAEIAESKTVAGARAFVQRNLDKEYQLGRQEAWDAAMYVMRNSKSGAERMHAAEFVTAQADKYEPPLEGYSVVDAHPENEKVVHISEADKKSVPIGSVKA